MPILERRRIVALGSTRVVSLPRGWLAFNGLKPGDFLDVLTDGEIRLRPIKKERTEATEEGTAGHGEVRPG